VGEMSRITISYSKAVSQSAIRIVDWVAEIPATDVSNASIQRLEDCCGFAVVPSMLFVNVSKQVMFNKLREMYSKRPSHQLCA
jgi:hypothetical protein